MVLAGCSTDRVVRLGVLTALPDEVGEAARLGAELMVREVNARGGVRVGDRRLPLSLVWADVGGTEESAARAAQHLVNRERVPAIVGPHNTRFSLGAGNVAERAHVPMVSAGSTHPATTEGKSYVFRVNITDTFQAEVLADLTREDLGAEHVAVLYDAGSRYARDIVERYRHDLASTSTELDVVESYTVDQGTDFSEPLARIRRAEPDVLFLPNRVEFVPEQARQARALGIDAVLLGTDTWEPLDTSIPELDGAFLVAEWHPSVPTPSSRAFVESFREAYHHDPSVVSAMYYDAVALVVRAVETEGSFEPEAIRRGLLDQGPYSGVTGEIDYVDSGDPRKAMVILRVEDGVVKLHRVVHSS